MLCDQKAAPEPQQLPRITASREDLAAMPVRQLKGILQERGIPITGTLSSRCALLS